MKRFFVIVSVLIITLALVGCSGGNKANNNSNRYEGEVREVDVVIVGAGGAGLSAAWEVGKAGKNVLIIEKNAMIGGNTAFAGSAANAADPAFAKQLYESGLMAKMTDDERANVIRFRDWGLADTNPIVRKWGEAVRDSYALHPAGDTYLYDSPELHALHTYFGGGTYSAARTDSNGGGLGKPEFLDYYAQNALPTLQWLGELGGFTWNTKWVTTRLPAAVGATWRRSHSTAVTTPSSGAGFYIPIANEINNMQNAKIELEWRADTLITDPNGGRVVAVSGLKPNGDRFTVKAKAIMLATGGFGRNANMLQAQNVASGYFWPVNFVTGGPNGSPYPTTNIAGITGDGLVMAMNIGAGTYGLEFIQMVSTYGSVREGGATDRMIMVNTEGRRYVREDGRRDILARAALLNNPHPTLNVSAAYHTPGLGGAFGIQDGHTVEELAGARTFDSAWVAAAPAPNTRFVADTLPELLTQLTNAFGATFATNVQASINQHNNIYDGRISCPFGRQVMSNRLDKGPWVVAWGSPWHHHVMGGLNTNFDMQVLQRETGNPIAGLYAAGEVIGGIHGENRLGGNAVTDVLVFGRRAGQRMLALEF